MVDVVVASSVTVASEVAVSVTVVTLYVGQEHPTASH
jgi:hypothetical protein